MQKRSIFAAVAAVAVMATSAYAIVTFDPATGTGFVGKGDVQLVYGWNNKDLQNKANLPVFRAAAESVTTWTCSKENPGHPEREIVQLRTNTTTTQGLISSVTRDNSKGKDGPVTGFALKGYSGEPATIVTGDPVGSCPAIPSGFEYDNNAQEVVIGGGVQVSINGTDWYNLQ
jgi:hypothetical protein